MTVHGHTLDLTLAAVAGDDPAIKAELRDAFCASLAYQIDLLSRARCDGNWRVAASRLRELGAGFHVDQVIELAEAALAAAPGDPAVLRRFHAVLRDLSI